MTSRSRVRRSSRHVAKIGRTRSLWKQCTNPSPRCFCLFPFPSPPQILQLGLKEICTMASFPESRQKDATASSCPNVATCTTLSSTRLQSHSKKRVGRQNPVRRNYLVYPGLNECKTFVHKTEIPMICSPICARSLPLFRVSDRPPEMAIHRSLSVS